MNHSEMRKFLQSLFSKVQIWGFGVKKDFLQFFVDILPLALLKMLKPRFFSTNTFILIEFWLFLLAMY